ncbi:MULTISPECIES: collagen-like protein [Nostocales]|uniref:collagen-like protein n=1 Tax=Nostocales TaxID=1161 RepID=UPI000495965C|nr:MULTISPECIES: collagen-like protein [Nostocales]
MPLNIDDTDNSAITGNPLNLRRVLNGFAFQIKALSGQTSWKVPPHLPITQLGLKGDKGDTGAQGIQGLKGDKGDPGEPAPINHTHAIADVSGLQAALDSKVLPHPGFVSGRYYSPAIYSSNVNTSFAVGYVYYTFRSSRLLPRRRTYPYYQRCYRAGALS